MVLPLILVFGAGAAASVALARHAGGLWLWVAAFLNLLIAFHELSFAFRPAAEWIRIDLLLSIPLFSLATLLLAVFAFRRRNVVTGAVLSLSVAAVPVFFVTSR
jgi:hypothetical protein